MIFRGLRWTMSVAMAVAGLISALVIALGFFAYLWVSDAIFFDVSAPVVEFSDNMTIPNIPPDILEPEDFSEIQAEEQFWMWADIAALLVAALGGSALGAVIGYRFAHRLAQPIETLSTTVNALSAGDLSARAEHGGIQTFEFEKLIQEFNAMAAELDRIQREQAESASAIAHELRTPVTVLRGRLQGLADGVFEPDAGTLHGLVAQTETLTRIIDDLQTSTLAKSERLELSPREIDLATEADTVLKAVEPLVSAGGLQVCTHLEPAPVFADPARIRQAIGALLENAHRYASEGGQIKIESGCDDRGSFVRVMDRGAGLSEAEAARAFDRFWRSDASRSRAFGGSGLGLAVVRSICKGHGGEANYESRRGGGAVFEILLPMLASVDAGCNKAPGKNAESSS